MRGKQEEQSLHGLEQRNNNDWQTEHALRNPSVDGNSAVRKLKVRSFDVRLCTMVIEHLLEQRDASPVQNFQEAGCYNMDEEDLYG